MMSSLALNFMSFAPLPLYCGRSVATACSTLSYQKRFTIATSLVQSGDKKRGLLHGAKKRIAMRNVRGLGKECNIYNNIYNIEEMAWSWRGQRGRIVEEGAGLSGRGRGKDERGAKIRKKVRR